MSPNGQFTVEVLGVGLLGPGLPTWEASQDILRGTTAAVIQPSVLPVPVRLPPADRRRAGAAVKVALAVADQAVAASGIDPAHLATVFTSSSGEGQNCHALCETLATAQPQLSPTRFTNSVHNAAAGGWHIAVSGRAASTSLCAFDGSLGAGLLDALAQLAQGVPEILLVASDSPYPEPLNALRPLPDHFGVALVLRRRVEGAAPTGAPILHLALCPAGEPSTPCRDPVLDALRQSIPAARALPLLEGLANGHSCSVVIDYLPHAHLRIDLRHGVGAA